jgi:hypothetical protein
MMMAALAIFQAWIQKGVHVGKFLFVYGLKTYSPRKVNIVGECLHIAGHLLLCIHVKIEHYNGLIWACRKTGTE